MKTKIIITLIIIYMVYMPLVGSISEVGNPESNKESKPGNIIFFNIYLKNDQIYDIDVKVQLMHYSLWNVTCENDEFFNVHPGVIFKVSISVKIPLVPINKTVNIDVYLYQRPSFHNMNEEFTIKEINYKLCYSNVFTCNVKSSSDSSLIYGLSSMVLILTALIATSILYYSQKTKKGEILHFFNNIRPIRLPLFTAYTRLRKDRVLRNPVRNNIMKMLKEKKEGATFKEIQIAMNITHPSYLNYHLRRMMEFGFVKNVDNLYYHQDAILKRPFISEIHDAMMIGARTPSEVATEIKSYPQKVRYHMKKHGLLNNIDVDYSKRRR